jgi:hypothetical protein
MKIKNIIFTYYDSGELRKTARMKYRGDSMTNELRGRTTLRKREDHMEVMRNEKHKKLIQDGRERIRVAEMIKDKIVEHGKVKSSSVVDAQSRE